MTRHTVALCCSFAAAALAVACTSSHGPEGGVCCPVTGFSGCSPGAEPLPGGGWAASLAECTYTIDGFDGRPFEHVMDARGCERVQEASSGCCGCVPFDGGPPPDDAPPLPIDAGPPEIDAGSSACDGLSVVPCLEAGCVPSFDDACCPSCMPSGGCADCTNWFYEACRPRAASCPTSVDCGTPAPWACTGTPDCSAASVTDEDSCSIAGCVPAYPSGVGEPDPLTAVCVPIHIDVCRIACRRAEPPCPERTRPEGDGFCYTDRCVPAFVCAP